MVDIHLNNYHDTRRDHYATGKTEKPKIKNKYKTRNESFVVLSCVARDGQTIQNRGKNRNKYQKKNSSKVKKKNIFPYVPLFIFDAQNTLHNEDG